MVVSFRSAERKAARQVAEAVTAVIRGRVYGPDAQEYAVLAPYLPADQRNEFLQKAVDAAAGEPSGGDALVRVAAYLPPGLLASAVTVEELSR